MILRKSSIYINKKPTKGLLPLALSLGVAFFSTSVSAQDNKTLLLASDIDVLEESEAEDSLENENVVTVTAKRRILTRNRVDGIAPVLSYDVEYFQRFEPSTLRDMLKRVPGIISNSLFSFSVTEANEDSENFSFRGLRGEAGQILINGRRVPGINANNSLSLSSIPAGIIKEVQIIRASRSSTEW